MTPDGDAKSSYPVDSATYTRIAAEVLHDAAADALAFSRDRHNKILPRIALRIAANWLTVRAQRIQDMYP